MDVDRTSWSSTLVKNHDNKTYILVKLSESFSNAIQEYSTANNHKRPKLQHNIPNSRTNNNNNSYNNNQAEAPTIKFHGSRGAIKFPNGKSYDFILQHSNNSVECIKQTKNKWESVGKMACCLHVKGKDDVYQRTRTKMEAAEQEKRKYCTKLLDGKSNSDATDSAPPIKSTSSTANTTIPTPTPTTATTTTTITASTKTATNKPNAIASVTAATAANSVTPATTTTKSSLLSSSSSSSTSTTSSSNHNSANDLSKYPDIKNAVQLKKYKAEFDIDFKEYQNLHGYLHRIEDRFRKLKESLRQSVEGSPEWEFAKEQIFSEYERVKSDSNFHRARNKYKQLYNKLAHLKEKIFQFKQSKQRDKVNSNNKKRKK